MIPDLLADETIWLVKSWLLAAKDSETRADIDAVGPLHELIKDPDGVAFVMRFVDRVARPDSNRAAAHQLAIVVRTGHLPGFLSATDRFLLRAGALFGRVLPGVIIPLARKRMRRLVGHLVVDSSPESLERHLAAQRRSGFEQNVNLLGEAVLGEREADRRLTATMALLDLPEVDYVSIKVSAVASQLNYWDWEGSLARVVDRLSTLFRRAAQTSPPTFVNLDMEEYHDLELTVTAFTTVLTRPEFEQLDAGIVLQAYLPESFAALHELVGWATDRRSSRGGEIKIRLVKGANLAMEQVDAAIHGWRQAPYETKLDVDANYKRCLDWVLTAERTSAVRVGVASHNLFDVAWAHLLSTERGVANRVEFEMLQGMAPTHSRVVRSAVGDELLLYTPIVSKDDFDVAISYLFRRLEENSAVGNFMRVLISLTPDSPDFANEAQRFRLALEQRIVLDVSPRRSQTRPSLEAAATTAGAFVNEPDTDPALADNRAWAMELSSTLMPPVSATSISSASEIDEVVGSARTSIWSHTSGAERRAILHRAADELARRRGDLVVAMMREGHKTFAQADPEVSEAIDFARYYGDRAGELASVGGASFHPLGVMAVIPPWNFPVAIPAGGVFASLAAGNTVLFKPSRKTPRCAEIVAECAWAAGVPHNALHFLQLANSDLGQHLIDSVDGVILTGSAETARMFQSWRPDLKLFAETSGKNAMIITPHADIDLAVADLVASAFGHAGQKCSAASLAICIGDVYDSPRFRRQLADAVESLVVGAATDLSTTVGPTITAVDDKLERGLTVLDGDETWLVEPQRLDKHGQLWRPGVRLGVDADSWYHQTECFGPVLGIMRARDLEHAIELQNVSEYGLTGGIHSLDPTEVRSWLDRVQVGNAYVNRQITGAVVQRQPFGGWKQSNIGPGAKAGGPNYVMQLGTWQPTELSNIIEAAEESDAYWWDDHFSQEHDPTGLFCEANVFRYRPLARIVIRSGNGADADELLRVEAAAKRCGVRMILSTIDRESDESFGSRIASFGVDRVRILGAVSDELRVAAANAHIHLADAPVTASGRIELLHYLREQSISQTLHRFGNLVGVSG